MSGTRSQFLRGVLRSVRAHVVAIDHTGRVTFVSRSVGAHAAGPITPTRTGENYLELLAVHADRNRAAHKLRKGISAVLTDRTRGAWIGYEQPADNPQRWYVARVVPLRSRRGGAIISHIDVTERRQSAEAVAPMEASSPDLDWEHERYRGIFESAGVAIWELDYRPVVRFIRRLQRLGIYDVRSCLRQRPRLIARVFRAVRVGDVNEEALRLTGAPDKETVRTLGPNDFLTLEDGFAEAIVAVAEGRREIRVNDLIRTFRGEERKVAVTLRIPADVANGGRVLFCAHDVTELDSTRRRYELAIAGGGITVFEYRIGADELVLDAHLNAVLGLPDGPIRGADLLSRIHPAEVDYVTSLYADAMSDDAPVDEEGNTPVSEYEFRLIAHDGSDRWFLKRGIVLRDKLRRPVVLIGTMTDITDRKLMEEAVRVSQDRLRDLAGRLIAAQEEERLRIARDLDDDLNERLGRIADTLRMLRSDVADQPAPIRAEISRLELEIERLRDEISGLAGAIHSAIPERTGIVSAFQSLCAEFGRIEGLDVTLEIGAGFASVPRPIGSCLYRVAQEALRNTARHSGSRVANVKLYMDNGHVCMDIRDFGCGFELPVKQGRSGLGLISMRERVRLAGGEMRITSSREAGTDVHISIPLSRD